MNYYFMFYIKNTFAKRKKKLFLPKNEFTYQELGLSSIFHMHFMHFSIENPNSVQNADCVEADLGSDGPLSQQHVVELTGIMT